MGKLYVYICGATRVRTDDGALVEKLGGVKPRQILEILALSLGRPVSKDRIADLLWDGEPPPSYVSTLESYVYVLRRHLGIRGRDAAVQTTTTGYLLRADQAQVDVCDAQQMLAAAGRERDQGERARLVGDALQLLDGELLASEPHTPWAAAHRTAFMRDATGWCLEAAEAALASGSTGLAGRLGRFVTTREALVERAWQVQMRSLAGEGRHAEALNLYARLRAVLQDELGTEPSPESQRLYVEVLTNGSDSPRQVNVTHELAALIRLLRQALEGCPGLRVPERDDDMAAVAVRMLAAA